MGIFIPFSISSPAYALDGSVGFESFPWLSASWDDDYLYLNISNLQPGSFTVYELDYPPRIVIDVPETGCPEDEPVYEAFNFNSIGLISQLRATCESDGTRYVLESRFPIHWEITSDENQTGLEILCYMRFRQVLEEIQIDEGTTYTAKRYVTSSGQRYVHVVISDPIYSDFRPGVILASDVTSARLASLNTIVENTYGAVVGVNGGYYAWPGLSLSGIIQDGRVTAPPMLHRPFFMVLDDGRYAFDYLNIRGLVTSRDGVYWEADVVNQTPGAEQVALLTPGHPTRIRSNLTGETSVILHGVVECVGGVNIEEFTDRYIMWSREIYPMIDLMYIGEQVEIDYVVESWPLNIIQAIQGGPFLVRNGQVDITSAQDDIGRDISQGRAARTAVGIDGRNRIYLVTVEGSYGGRSIGSTLDELAWTLIDFGATWAINLDGGSSSGMAMTGTNPQSGLHQGARQLATALVLIDQSLYTYNEEFFF